MSETFEEYRKLCVAPRARLEDDLERVSGDYDFWARRMNEAHHKLSGQRYGKASQEESITVLKAQLSVQLKSRVVGMDSKNNPKYPSDTAVAAQVLAHEDYKQAMNTLGEMGHGILDLQFDYENLRSTVRSIEIKIDMLRPVAKALQEEQKQDFYKSVTGARK